MRRHAWGPRVLGLALLLAAVPAAPGQGPVDTAAQDYSAAAIAFNDGFYDLAVPQFEQFLAKYPNDSRAANARYALGISYYRQKSPDYDKADKTLAIVVADKNFPNRPTALFCQAQARRAAGRQAEAAAVFLQLAAEHPTDKLADKAAVGAGESLYFAKQYAEAAKVLADVPARFPTSPLVNQAILIRGLSLYEAKDFAAARDVLADSLKREPAGEQAAQVAYLLGSAREQTARNPDDFAAALEAYKQSYAAPGKSRYAADAMYRAAFLLSRRDDLDGAIGLLEKVAGTNGELADVARLNAGQFALKAKQYDKAIQVLTPLEAKAASELADDAAYYHGKALLAAERLPQAVAQFDKAAKFKNPTFAAEIQFEWGVALLTDKKYAPALEKFKQFAADHAKDNHPLLTDALFNAAAAAFGAKDYAASADWCSRLLAAKPREELAADATYMKAECLMQDEKSLAEAAKTFAAFAAAYKRHEKVNLAWLQCGIAQYRTKQFAEALISFNQIPLTIRSNAPFVDSIFLGGDCCYNLNEFREAVARLRSYRQFAPTGAYADICLLKLGLALQNLELYAEAKDTFARIRADFPKSPYVAQATFELGQCAASLKPPDHKAAADAFAQVAAMTTPEAERFTAKATYNLGWADMQSGKHAEAAAAFGRLADKWPKDELAGDATLLAGISYDAAGDLANAESRLQGYVTKFPQDKQLFKGMVRLAGVLTKEKKHAEAAAVLEKAAADARFAAEPTLDAALYDLAWSYRSVEPAQTDKAEATYRTLLGKFPKSDLAANASVELAQILFDREKRDADGVVKLLEPLAAGEVKPELADAVNYMLGWCLFEQGKYEPAAGLLMKVAAKAGARNAAVSAYQAGEAYSKLGTFDKAAEAYGIVFSQYPKDPLADAAGLRQGESLSKTGDYGGTVAVMDKVLAAFPASKLLAEMYFARGWAQENLAGKGTADARAKALADYAKVAELSQAEVAARAHFQTGELYAAAGEYDKAVVELLKVKVYGLPTWTCQATLEMGRVFEAQDKKDEAVKMYRQVVEKFADTPQAKMAQDRLAALGG